MDENMNDFLKEVDAEFDRAFNVEKDVGEPGREPDGKKKPGVFQGTEGDGFYARFVRTPGHSGIYFYDAATDSKIGHLSAWSFELTLEDGPDVETLISIVRFVGSLKVKD